MASPGTLGNVGMGASAAGAGLNVFSSLLGGEAQQENLNYQAGIADINSKLAKQDADYTRAVGEVNAQASGMKTRQMIGAQTAAQGASGIDLASGSAVEVRKSQAAVGAQDQILIRSEAAKKAYGYEVEATKQKLQGDNLRAAGSNARLAGWLGAGSSVLGGVSSVASKWSQGNSIGLGTTTGAGSGKG